MWKDASIAMQEAAKLCFATKPGTQTMLASADGSLFDDNKAGQDFARKHCRAGGGAIARLTRAGGVVPFLAVAETFGGGAVKC
ncbi:MAG: hypothetical protein M3Y54_02600 [Bacteroidota bacterium]|nr:hypothetical protein [Bacteroidota bacterium]